MTYLARHMVEGSQQISIIWEVWKISTRKQMSRQVAHISVYLCAPFYRCL